MNSKIVILIIFSILLVVGIGLVVFQFIKVKDDSSKKLVLSYTSTAGIPFRWIYDIEDENIVELAEAKVLKNHNKSMSGGKIETHYVFKGLKKGTTKIHFHYIRFDMEEDQIEKSDTYTVIVDENLNISLEENDSNNSKEKE